MGQLYDPGICPRLSFKHAALGVRYDGIPLGKVIATSLPTVLSGRGTLGPRRGSHCRGHFLDEFSDMTGDGLVSKSYQGLASGMMAFLRQYDVWCGFARHGSG